MTTQKRNKLMVRWAILSAVVTALFWAIWYLIAGSVPVVESLKMTENWTLQLPFAISRWTDILFMPVLSTLIIWLIGIEKPKNISQEDWLIGIAVGIFAGIAVGIFAGIGTGIFAGIAVGIFAGIGTGIGAGIVWLLKKVFSMNSWKKLGSWLIVKEE